MADLFITVSDSVALSDTIISILVGEFLVFPLFIIADGNLAIKLAGKFYEEI